MAKPVGTRWARFAATRGPDWVADTRRHPDAQPVQVRCVWTDKPGHLHGGPRGDGWRCPVCVADFYRLRQLLP